MGVTYQTLLDNIFKSKGREIPSRVLCLDPGETTGWCLFDRGELVDFGQIRTVIKVTMGKKEDKFVAWGTLEKLFQDTHPTHIVCENYRVYAHKLERHSNSEIHTVRLIGGIDYLAHKLEIPLVYQMASQAKGFVTDDRLKAWDFWQPGMRHARDAIRHGIYWLLIGNNSKQG